MSSAKSDLAPARIRATSTSSVGSSVGAGFGVMRNRCWRRPAVTSNVRRAYRLYRQEEVLMRAWFIGCVLVAAACGGTTKTPASPTAAGATATADAALGAKLFASKCAECHGDQGQGTQKAPPLVGKDALPKD